MKIVKSPIRRKAPLVMQTVVGLVTSRPYIKVNKLSSHGRTASVHRMEVIRFCSLYAPFINTSLSMIRSHGMKSIN